MTICFKTPLIKLAGNEFVAAVENSQTKFQDIQLNSCQYIIFALQSH